MSKVREDGDNNSAVSFSDVTSEVVDRIVAEKGIKWEVNAFNPYNSAGLNEGFQLCSNTTWTT